MPIETGSRPCTCDATHPPPRLVALTGGPGAGKTAVLEMARRVFCDHVLILPEAAGIVFGGGFPRNGSGPGRRAAQEAIFHVQRALEGLAVSTPGACVALCDRGTLDGLAYWPDPPETFWAAVGSTPDAERARYSAVVHLDTPNVEQGYRRDTNHLRIESVVEAEQIDARIAAAWAGHPRRFEVDSRLDFLDKAIEALRHLRDQVPPCCRSHGLPGAAE